MANILSAEDVYKSYGEKTLVDHVSFGIDEGQRIGLIGVNGTGKSTLLKMIAGEDVPDSGSITLSGGAKVHYLPQEPDFADGQSILTAVFEGDLPQMVLLREYESTLRLLEHSPESPEYQQKLIRIQARMEDLHVWELEHEAKAILTKLGLTDFSATVDTLSGGQRKRVALARALIQPSDLLILDEPTNHIDDETAGWLESYLSQRKGALFMVTHDRYFLDNVANRIFELHQGNLYQYSGNYDAFLEKKAEREAQALASEEKRQNFLRNELKWVQRGARARGTKQKARMDKYYEVLEQDVGVGNQTVEISSASTRLGKTVIELDNVSKGYVGDPPLISNFTYIVQRNDRIGVIGENGMGKSTLLKLMSGKTEPDTGSVTIGSTVKIGYFAQEHDEMPTDMRPIDYIREEAEYVETADGESITAAQMLERFLFPGNLQWTPIAKLSGGEKRRLALLRTLMAAPNVLLMDEPTNDLDIPTLTILESYLDNFAGAVIVVSHDRYFLDMVCEKILSFDGNGMVSVHFGNFSDYLERVKDRDGSEASNRKKPTAKTTTGATEAADGEAADGDKEGKTKPKKLKFTFSEQKEYETIDDDIAAVEQSLQEIAAKMEKAGSDYGKVQELFNEQQDLEKRLDKLLERWTYLNELAEQIEESKSK